MLLIRTSVTVTVRPCMQLESHLLLRRMSVLLQRFNSILFHETFSVQGNRKQRRLSHSSSAIFIFSFNPQDLYYWGW